MKSADNLFDKHRGPDPVNFLLMKIRYFLLGQFSFKPLAKGTNKMFEKRNSPFSIVVAGEAMSFLGLSSAEYFEASKHGTLKRSVEIRTGFANTIMLHNLWDLFEFKLQNILHLANLSASDILAMKIADEIATAYDNCVCASFQPTFAEIEEILRFADCSIGALTDFVEDQWAKLTGEISIQIASLALGF